MTFHDFFNFIGFSLLIFIYKFGDCDLFSFKWGSIIFGDSGFILIGFLDP
jgi:hypothetical protein